MNVASRFATPAAISRGREIELQLPVLRGWGLAPVVIDAGKDAGPSRDSGINAAEMICTNNEASPDPSRLRRALVQDRAYAWIGAEPQAVVIGGCNYRLSFVFLGSSTGEETCVGVDPTLPVGGCPADSEPRPGVLTTYEEFDPATRRAFLKWIDEGRRGVDAPEPFLLHFIHSLEIAIIVHERRDVVPVARAAIDALLLLHPRLSNFRHCADSFIELCDWIDPAHVAEPIYANGEGNHLNQMPFAVRRYLGEALARSTCLEADAALLLLLKQPNKRLEAHIGQHFEVVYRNWVENYSYRFNGGIELDATERLSLEYECLDGTRTELPSNIPDPASAALPSELQTLFDECCFDLNELRGLSVAQQVALIKGLKSKPAPRGGQPEWSLRHDFEARISACLQPPGPVLVKAAEVLSDLFENTELPAKKQVPVNAVRRLQRALSDVGVGFEPDVRFGLPARIRPDTQIALFLEEQWPFEEPGDAFHLAQAALTLSAVGARHFQGLQPLRVADIEPLLPYRHRFSDREVRRLEATFLFMRSAGEPRALLKCWSRLMKRHQRVKEIDQGFGIAFHAQAGSPLVKRFATAVSKALHDDERRVRSFLCEVQAQAKVEPEVEDQQDCLAVSGEHSKTESGATIIPFAKSRLASRPAPRSPIDGLPLGVAEILIALLERPHSRTELNDIAFRHQLRISGALEQLNEWSLERHKTHATRGHSTLRINPEVFEAVKLLARKS